MIFDMICNRFRCCLLLTGLEISALCAYRKKHEIIQCRHEVEQQTEQQTHQETKRVGCDLPCQVGTAVGNKILHVILAQEKKQRLEFFRLPHHLVDLFQCDQVELEVIQGAVV